MKNKTPYQVTRPNNNHRQVQLHNQKPNISINSHKFFDGNLVQDMKFGGKDHELSGFVMRTVYMKDQHGNVQVAKEKQFFNSSKKPMQIMIQDDKKNASR